MSSEVAPLPRRPLALRRPRFLVFHAWLVACVFCAMSVLNLRGQEASRLQQLVTGFPIGFRELDVADLRSMTGRVTAIDEARRHIALLHAGAWAGLAVAILAAFAHAIAGFATSPLRPSSPDVRMSSLSTARVMWLTRDWPFAECAIAWVMIATLIGFGDLRFGSPADIPIRMPALAGAWMTLQLLCAAMSIARARQFMSLHAGSPEAAQAAIVALVVLALFGGQAILAFVAWTPPAPTVGVLWSQTLLTGVLGGINIAHAVPWWKRVTARLAG